ncbi:MAG: hypothetical protein GXY44_02565 [Phycisphaerales bacterium]|nr:hypothetical protein [Phycisphaerales bacterium]
MAPPLFVVDVSGEFSERQVVILWRDEPQPPHAALDRLVEDTWTRLCEQKREKGTWLYNGRMLRYLRHRLENGKLIIEAGPTDYAAFMATNYLNPHRAEEFGWEAYSNPIGISATVIASDGWLLYGRRNEQVACMAGYAHTFGGTLERDEMLADGTFDAFAGLRRELDEELGLKEKDIERLICLGMIRDGLTRQPELIFDAYIRLTKSDIAARVRPGCADEEHAEILACRNSPDAVLPFIRDTHQIAPVLIGAIMQHGRYRFGPAWYGQANKYF